MGALKHTWLSSLWHAPAAAQRTPGAHMEAPADDELHRRRERPLHQLICREAEYLPRRMPQQHALADREGLMVCWLSQDWPMGAMSTSWHTDHVILAC